MAPEQIEGHPRAASDQYALGVVVYEWLCGNRPFEGSVTEVMVQHLTMPPSPLHERVPTISAEVEQVVLQALAKDPKVRFASVREFATAFEQASLHASSPKVRLASEQPAPGPTAAPSYATVAVVPNQPAVPTEATPSADLPVVPRDPTALPGSSVPHAITEPPSQGVGETPLSGQIVVPTAAVLPSPLEPTLPVQRKARHLPRITAGLLIGLVALVIAGAVLGSLSLLARFGMLGARSVPPAATPVQGGTWTQDIDTDPHSPFPNQGDGAEIDQALYLPLFYGDPQGVVHPGRRATSLRCTMAASALMPRPGRSICDPTWCGRMGSPMMPAAWTSPGSSGASSVPPMLGTTILIQPSSAGQTSRRTISRSPSAPRELSLRFSRCGWLLCPAASAPVQRDTGRGYGETA
jgi:hypothetical protein